MWPAPAAVRAEAALTSLAGTWGSASQAFMDAGLSWDPVQRQAPECHLRVCAETAGAEAAEALNCLTLRVSVSD